MIKKLVLWTFNKIRDNISIELTPIQKYNRIEEIEIEVWVLDNIVYSTTRKLHRVKFLTINL